MSHRSDPRNITSAEKMLESIRRRVAKYHEVDANGCWIWTRSLTNTGYGRLQVTEPDGRSTAWVAHKAAYYALVGPVPESLHLDHLCREPKCVNPAHLEPVTCRENLMRSPVAPAAIHSAQTECHRGHPFNLGNTYIEPKTGNRQCRTCRADWMRESRARRRAVAGA